MTAQKPTDFLVVTILDLEANALNQLGFESNVDANGRAYCTKSVGNTNMDRNVDLVHYSVGSAGNVKAGTLVADLLNLWSPKCVVVLGIAAGIKQNGANICDILIGSSVIYYSLTKETPHGTERRPDSIPVDTALLSQIRMYKDSVLSTVNSGMKQLYDLIARFPKVLEGPILAGESLMAAQVKTEEILVIHPKAIGVEMESYGVHMACQNHLSRPRVITIRGVSDYGDEVKDDSYQDQAASMAALFLLMFASTCDLTFIEQLLPEAQFALARTYIDYTTEFPDIYHVEVDRDANAFFIKGHSMDFLWPRELAFQVMRRIEVPEAARIQIGAALEVSGCLRRLSIVGYSCLKIDYVLFDVYRNRMARFPVMLSKLEWLFDPLELEVNKKLIQSTHYNLVGLGGVEAEIVPGPYWVGVEGGIGLVRGGSVAGASVDDPLTIRVQEIEWSSY